MKKITVDIPGLSSFPVSGNVIVKVREDRIHIGRIEEVDQKKGTVELTVNTDQNIVGFVEVILIEHAYVGRTTQASIIEE